jgi:hypothetical protein
LVVRRSKTGLELALLAGAALALTALAGGCAKPGPPGGGPVDSVAPFVERTDPPAGAVEVDASGRIEIEFSEEMNRLSVERSVSVTPSVALRNFRWSGRTLIAEPEGSFPDSSTIVFEIGSDARDYHDVRMDAPFALAFSTGGEVDDGLIAGTVTAGGDPTERAIVWACPGAVAPDTAGVLHPCGYTTTTGEDGAFRIAHVRAATAAYTLVAFLDRDGDRRYAEGVETGGVASDAALIEAPGDSAVGIVIPIEPPESREGARAQEGEE